MKIIIVDDDCLVAGALKTILEANPDIEVTATGSDGEEACSLYREYLPDILLMDIRMKGMDGLEASRKILGEFPEAKILLLTTFSDDEYIVKALRLGTKGYLLKREHLRRSSGSSGGLLPARPYSAQRSYPKSLNSCSLPTDLIMLPETLANGSWISSG